MGHTQSFKYHLEGYGFLYSACVCFLAVEMRLKLKCKHKIYTVYECVCESRAGSSHFLALRKNKRNLVPCDIVVVDILFQG